MRSSLVALGSALLLPVAALSLSAPAGATTSTPDWLHEVNMVRGWSHLSPVTAETGPVAGMKKHIYYLVHDTKWQTGQYRNLHDENPAAPDYSSAGHQAGETSVIAFGSRNDVAAVDGWFEAPIHASDILKPDLSQIAFYRDPASGDAMLFTGGGLAANNARVLYPGSGGTTQLTRYGGENPDPTTSCPAGYGAGKSGLPLLAILPSAPSSQTTGTLSGPRGSVPVCVIDQNNFNASDPVYGPTAAQYFANGLVLMIPKVALIPGTYHAELKPGGQSPISWSFTSAPKPLPPSLGYDRTCSFTNPAYASGQAQIGVTNPSDTLRSTTYTVTMNRVHKSVTVGDGKFGHTAAFGHLHAGTTYPVSATGNDHTSATERIAIPGCPAWIAVRPSGGSMISAAKHTVTQKVSNIRNLAAITFTVTRSGMSTLHFKIAGKSSRTIVYGIHPHGRTSFTYLVGTHKLYSGSITLP